MQTSPDACCSSCIHGGAPPNPRTPAVVMGTQTPVSPSHGEPMRGGYTMIFKSIRFAYALVRKTKFDIPKDGWTSQRIAWGPVRWPKHTPTKLHYRVETHGLLQSLFLIGRRHFRQVSYPAQSLKLSEASHKPFRRS